MTTIIIYHAHCTDGNAAAWVGQRKFSDAILYPADHGETPPDVTGADVYVLDFSYKRAPMLALKQQAKSLLVLDHHEKARDIIGDLNFCIFDLEKSGAGLAWDYFFPDQPRPFFISYIEDRDLWRWALPHSEEINAGISSFPRNFATLTSFFEADPKELFEDLLAKGYPVVQYKKGLISGLAKHAYEVEFEGHRVLVCNTATLQSELGAELCKNHAFSITWFKNERGVYIYSLRSLGFDVGAIAVKYGGGGHPMAAGFQANHPMF